MRTNDLCRRTSQHAVLFWQTSPWIDESRVGRKFFTRSGVIFLRLNLVDTTLGGTVFLTFQVDKSVQYCERTVSQVFCHFTPPLYNDFCRTLLVCIPCLHHGLMLVIPCLSRWKFVPDTDKEDFWFPHGVRLQICIGMQQQGKIAFQQKARENKNPVWRIALIILKSRRTAKHFRPSTSYSF